MLGGAFFSALRRVREAVGVYPSAQGIVLAQLCAPERGEGHWAVSEMCRTGAVWVPQSDPALLASLVREELVRAGWERLPLALTLPAAEAETAEIELPAALHGEELRSALMWALRARDEGLAADCCLCCSALPDTWAHRYAAAVLPRARLHAIWSAFAEEKLALRRLTFYPQGGGECAEDMAAARALQMPWESAETAPEEDALPAVYAGLLLRRGTPAHLYLTDGKGGAGYLRRYAAAAIAVCVAALTLLAAAADITAYVKTMHEQERVAEELALHEADRRRMEERAGMRADTVRREELLTSFFADSLPWRALLVHLGNMTADGVRIVGVRAEDGDALWMEGHAVHYEALAAMMRRWEERGFFRGGIALETAVQERGEPGQPARIRFVLRAQW